MNCGRLLPERSLWTHDPRVCDREQNAGLRRGLGSSAIATSGQLQYPTFLSVLPVPKPTQRDLNSNVFADTLNGTLQNFVKKQPSVS